MRKVMLLVALALAGLAAIPDAGEARCWRRGRPAPAGPCYYPVYYCQPVLVSPCYYPQPIVIGPAQAVPAARTVTIKGRTYRIHPTGQPGEHDVEELDKELLALTATSNLPVADRFHGTVRRLPKTTIFAGDPKTFDSVSALRDWLPDNDTMIGLRIARGPAVNRVAQERFNVQVPAYIYAFRKESDNDYHVIIGDPPDADSPQYLNAEVSGIPTAGTDANRNTLWDVRRAFKEAFQLGDSGPDSYFRPDPPVPVRVMGSLFWDPEHQPPHTVGPSDFSPGTAWEIHPISAIEFQ
jgi:hypothetical protein